MKKSRQTKRALIPSILAVIMCVAMLIGTTFAWFTDTASTSVNKIEAGKLDVALYYGNNATGSEGTEWTPLSGENPTLSFLQTNTDKQLEQNANILWEPGGTYSLPALKIVNEGNLALKYKVVISGINGSADLNDVIDWTITDDANASVTAENISTAEFVLTGKDDFDILTIKGHMQDTAGNDYQGKSIDGITIAVVAAQKDSEYDSNGNTYDAQATYSLAVKDEGQGTLVVEKVVTKDGSETWKVKEGTTITSGSTSVTYPANVMLTGTTPVAGNEDIVTVTQKLEYKDTTPTAGITVTGEQAVARYELTLPVPSGNTVLVTVTKQFIAGLTGVEIYHNTTKLTQVTTAPSSTTGEECFIYDKATGVLTLYLKHASPINIVYDKPGVATVTSEAEFVTALANSEIKTIKLGGDFTMTDNAIQIDRAVTIDLNGKTLTASKQSVVGDDGVLTIQDSGTDGKLTFNNRGGGIMLNAGKLVLNSGKIYKEDGENIFLMGAAQFVMNGGSLSAKTRSCVDASYGSGEAGITINGGTIESETTNTCVVYIAGRFGNGSVKAVINGGTIKSSSGKTVEIGDTNSSLTITGGDFTGAIVKTAGTVTITGGTFNADPSAYVNGTDYSVDNNNGTWTVKAN